MTEPARRCHAITRSVMDLDGHPEVPGAVTVDIPAHLADAYTRALADLDRAAGAVADHLRATGAPLPPALAATTRSTGLLPPKAPEQIWNLTDAPLGWERIRPRVAASLEGSQAVMSRIWRHRDGVVSLHVSQVRITVTGSRALAEHATAVLTPPEASDLAGLLSGDPGSIGGRYGDLADARPVGIIGEDPAVITRVTASPGRGAELNFARPVHADPPVAGLTRLSHIVELTPGECLDLARYLV